MRGSGRVRPDLDAAAKLAVAVDDRAHVVEIFEAVDDAAHRHLERHVDDLAALDAQKAVDELLGVHQAAAGERVRVDQLDQVVELERRVLGRRRGQQDDARAARALADRGGAKVELPGALAAVAAAAHEFRKTVLAGLGLVAVFEGRGLVDDQHVDADVVPGDAGVELVALGQLEHLLYEGAHAVLEDRLVALGQVVGLLLGGVALAQLDLALEALDGLDVVQQRLLVHLGARERVVAQDHHVVEAGLEGAPLRGALLGRVGLRGEQTLAFAAGDPLAVAADHQDAVVGEYAQKVVVPLPDQRARHEYDWAVDPALLPRRRDDADGGVGLADADVEGDQAPAHVEHAQDAGDLVGLELRAGLVPAREVQRAAVVGGDDDAAKGPVVGVAHDGLAVLLGADPGGELAIPVAPEQQADLAEVLLLVGLLVFVVRVGRVAAWPVAASSSSTSFWISASLRSGLKRVKSWFIQPRHHRVSGVSAVVVPSFA
jgi:hypothetical protein